MDQELCLVWLYCVIEAALRSMVGTEHLRTRGPEPELTDAEVLTLQIWGEMRGLASDAAIWRDATAKLREWFPRLGAEWNFVRRCGNLAGVQERLLTLLFGPSGDWNAFDGLPLPVCRCRSATTSAPGVTDGSPGKRHGHSVRRRTRCITASRPGC
jgi:hypothetical protein